MTPKHTTNPLMGKLLLEIGTEEIPAGYIAPALRQMEVLFKEGLKKNRLGFGRVETFGTPCHLGLYAEGIPEKQPAQTEELPGPSSKIGLDSDGRPTKAGLGFARAQGVDFSELQVKDTPKGSYLFAVKTHEGVPSIKLLPGILSDVIRSISFPKKMRWRGPGLSFARPISRVMALFDAEVIEFELNGIKSGRVTRGHPFLSGKMITIKKADLGTYKDLLRKEKVIVDPEERKTVLRDAINAIMRKYGSELSGEEKLLEEVNYLVEYPFPVECTFPEEFLRVPQEVVETVMISHQRYFPVEDGNGRLLSRFVAVCNRDEQGARRSVEGNERVLRARLADAKFFWEEDRKRSLKDWLDGLKDVVFHEKLGSYRERTERIDRLSAYLARKKLNLADAEKEALHQAALLCKADLLTQMVGEFPELQGVMGYHYAREEGLPEDVALAIKEHYMPRHARDKMPESRLGMMLSLADKFDALCGCFSVGLVPTGSQDPYGLRRQAQGIIRILESHRLSLSLQDTIVAALENFPGKGTAMKEINAFFRDRLYQTFLERGHRYDVINAVLSAGFDDVSDFSHRVGVISRMSESTVWNELVTLTERTFNIGRGAPSSGEVDEGFLQQDEERHLWDVYVKNKDKITAFIDDKKYEEASALFCETFAGPVHTFFDKVFVNVEDKKLRNNRLVLVKKINELYGPRVAELSQIVPVVASSDTKKEVAVRGEQGE